MQVDKKIYFLQPSLDQAIAVARILKQNNQYYLVGAFLLNEKITNFHKKLYNDVIYLENYLELPRDGIVVPFGALSTETMLKNKDIHLENIVMTQSALAVFEKEKFINFCLINGLPVPKTWNFESELNDSNFPVFYKQRYEQGGGVRGIARTKSELPKKNQENLIYQEYINTVGTYGVGFIAKDGKLEVCFPHFESHSYPESGGSAVEIKYYNSSRLIQLTKQYIEKSNYSGWGLAEYKWCNKRQDFVFMEINAKLWASCEFSFRNEPKFMELLFGVQCIKNETLHGVFLNRMLLVSSFRTLIYLIFNKDVYKFYYPISFKEFVISFLPKFIIKFLN